MPTQNIINTPTNLKLQGSARAGTKCHRERPQGKDRWQTRRVGHSLIWSKLGVGTGRLLCYSSYESLYFIIKMA